MKKLVFIFHGKVNKRAKLFSEIQQVFRGDYELIQLVTERANHGIELSQQAVQEGATHIICVGGDGSLHEVANGVMKGLAELQPDMAAKVRVGLLPHGSGNDFAKTMHLTTDINALKTLIDKDTYLNIDLGFTEYTNLQGVPASRYVINITDVGIGGAIAERLLTSSKIFGPFITYQKAIVQSLITYNKKTVQAKADDYTYNGKIMSLIIANGKWFGAGLGIAPDAIATDGKFSVVILGDISLFDYLLNLGKVQKCQKLTHPQVSYLSAKEVYIQSPEGPLPIDMDGEFIGYSPMKVSMVPGALKFLSDL